MLRPVGKPRVAEEIVEQLRGLILKGVYSPGQRLPPERRLADELKVNRATLREALKSLEQAGLVRTRQGDGTRVLPFAETAGLELLAPLLGSGTLDAELLADLLEVRRLLGRDLAERAALRATVEELRRLEPLGEKGGEGALTVEELLHLDFQLLSHLAQAGRSRIHALLINSLRAAVEKKGALLSANAPRRSPRELVKAILARDGQRAVQLADAYFKKSGEQILSSLKN